MIGLVLAAGMGRRLSPLTDDLPKALVPVRENRSILDLTLANFAAIGLHDVAIVTGFAAHRIEERVPSWTDEHGLSITLVPNDRALEWNNAYSLWCARDVFAEGALLCNGDTLHPVVVQQRLLAADGATVAIALDRQKKLAEEEMKVHVDDQGSLRRITKMLDPAAAHGEYIGVSLIPSAAAGDLADALRATFERDPQLYYEDGYQELVDRGGTVRSVDIGVVEWTEVDDHHDLERAREIACRY